MKKTLLLVLWLCLLLLACDAEAEEGAKTVMLSYQGGEVALYPTTVGEETFIFLPAFVQQESFTERNRITLLDQIETGKWLGCDESGQEYTVMQGANVNALFFFSDDPCFHGYNWVLDCLAHENEASGSILLIDPNGVLLCEEQVKKIRGRGNTTWEYCRYKAPFQITLEKKRNLLNLQDKGQSAKKWLLLAELFDPQLLHNRIANDLALELGMTECAESSSVDVYYDGVYCGVYTLCEKVEVADGRVEIRNFDKVLDYIGFDAETAKPQNGLNAYGQPLQYFSGIPETVLPTMADYLIEMEGGDLEKEGTFRSGDAWFMHSHGKAYSFKNPQYANEHMLCRVSESLEELWAIIKNGGVHPQTGKTLQQMLDIDAMARTVLVNDYTYCVDGMTWSSFYLIYDSQNDFWRPGPVWDFDLSMRYELDEKNKGGYGLYNTDENLWLTALIQLPQIQQAMLRIWQEEMRPILTEVLLGDRQGRYLKPYDAYLAEIFQSRKMNETIHPLMMDLMKRLIIGKTMDDDEALTRTFLQQRVDWMDLSLGHMYCDSIDVICMLAQTRYLDTEQSFVLTVMPCFCGEVTECRLYEVEAADRDHKAIWTVEADVEGHVFADSLRVYVNGVPCDYERNEENRLHLCFSFYDQTYQPVETDDGMDIGLLLDLAWLRANRPDLSEMYPLDEDLIAYYYYVGMEEGLQGNEWYRPEFIKNYIIGTEESDYAMDAMSFLEYGQYEWDYVNLAEQKRINLYYGLDILPVE